MCQIDADRGAGAVEYAILIAGVAAVIVIVLYLFGSQVLKSFQTSCNTIATHTGTNCSTGP